jgi:hypothetical protein
MLYLGLSLSYPTAMGFFNFPFSEGINCILFSVIGKDMVHGASGEMINIW